MSELNEKVKVFFKRADKDGNGCLTCLELCKVLLEAGFAGTADDVVSWFRSIDVNDDDKITLDELLQQMNLRDPKSVQESELRAVFKSYDKDGSGFITVAELQEVMNKCGKKGDAEKFISCVDTDKDGKINYEEFLKMWRENS